jgi:hypothetical protein
MKRVASFIENDEMTERYIKIDSVLKGMIERYTKSDDVSKEVTERRPTETDKNWTEIEIKKKRPKLEKSSGGQTGGFSFSCCGEKGELLLQEKKQERNPFDVGSCGDGDGDGGGDGDNKQPTLSVVWW